MKRVRLTACAVAMALAAAGASASRADAFIDTLLRDRMHFSAGDMRALASGSAVLQTLDTPVREELAHFGVVHVNAPVERFLERFRDIVRFESGPGIPQIGRFHDPPRLEDLASLIIPPDDLEALRGCRPGNCDVKLPAAAIQRFRQDVDWKGPDAARQANVLLRGTLFDLVRAYQAKGNAALGEYDDRGDPVDVEEQFDALLASGAERPVPVPDLIAYLREYPRGRPAGVEEFFYWSVVKFGLKPTIRVNHVVIQPLKSASNVSFVVAIKQLYASHYFRTALELRFLVDDQSPRTGFYLISITRSRIDGTTGLTGLVLRPIISHRSRNGVRVYLEHVKHQVEAPDPAQR